MNEIAKAGEMVNHPPHYKFGKFESIEIIEDVLGYEMTKGFALGNALKYILRSMKKGKEQEDRHKAMWYLQFLDELEARHV